MELAIRANQLESESHQANILDGLGAYMHQLNNRSNLGSYNPFEKIPLMKLKFHRRSSLIMVMPSLL